LNLGVLAAFVLSLLEHPVHEWSACVFAVRLPRELLLLLLHVLLLLLRERQGSVLSVLERRLLLWRRVLGAPPRLAGKVDGPIRPKGEGHVCCVAKVQSIPSTVARALAKRILCDSKNLIQPFLLLASPRLVKTALQCDQRTSNPSRMQSANVLLAGVCARPGFL
jgi:hypothetical protein